jgi:hypothetical protein
VVSMPSPISVIGLPIPKGRFRRWMPTRCARFPVAGLGLRCSVSGPRR